MIEVEKLRGTDPACNSNAQTQLVEAKWEMVRAGRLSHCGAAVRRFCWLDTCDRL